MERDSARLRGAPLPLLRHRGMPEAQCCLLRMLWGTTKHVCCPVAKQKMMKSSGPAWGCCLQPFLVCSASRWAGRGPLCSIPVVGAGTEAKPPLRSQHLSSWDPSLPAALAAWLPQPHGMEHGLHPRMEKYSSILLHGTYQEWQTSLRQICTHPLVCACETRLRKALT